MEERSDCSSAAPEELPPLSTGARPDDLASTHQASGRHSSQVKENQRDTRWTTWTTAQGFPVMGIWKNTSDTTDINACDRSPCGRYLAAVDDSGMV